MGNVSHGAYTDTDSKDISHDAEYSSLRAPECGYRTSNMAMGSNALDARQVANFFGIQI